MKGLSWGSSALRKQQSEWQERSYTSGVAFQPPVPLNLHSLVGSQMTEGQGGSSSAGVAPIYQPGDVPSNSDSDNDSGVEAKGPKPRWIEESKEAKSKIAFRKSWLKQEQKQREEEDPIKRYGEKQRQAQGFDEGAPAKKSRTSNWQWNAQLVSSDELEARRKASLAQPASKWTKQSEGNWKPILRHEEGASEEAQQRKNDRRSSSTNKGASSWRPKG